MRLYHGNQSKFVKFVQGKDWVAFDGKKIKRPVWLSPDKKFAELYARPQGYVYTVDYNPKKLFPGQDELTEFSGRYIELTPFGEKLRDDLISMGVVEDDEEAESLVKEISNLGYDVMETSFMIDWLTANGYSAFEVRGDGPTNIAVMDINNITIINREHIQDIDSLQEIRRLINKTISECFLR